MKYFSASLVVLLTLFSTGCVLTKDTSSKFGQLDSIVTEQLLLALDIPQQAIFQVSHGLSSGFGEAILNQQTGLPHTLNGKPLSVNSAKLKRIIKKALPKCFTGQPQILVSAKITLHEKKDRFKSVIEAVVAEVYDVNVLAQACENNS